MGTQRRSWRQDIKQHPFIIVGIAVTIFVLIVFTLAVSKFSWDWTGFTSVTGPTLYPNEQYRPAKTLWDALQLLIIPILLTIGGFLLNQIQKDRDKIAEEAQKQREEDAAKERERLERESREDNQHETALQAYIDKMSELLLAHNLRNSTEGDEVRQIARVRTLTVLRRLDAERKGNVLRFLQEAGLINKEKTIVMLKGADLSEATLREATLSEANLCETDLRGADLQLSDLSGANLSEAKLREARLFSANLPDAILIKANLRGADLREANLSAVDLSMADLSAALQPHFLNSPIKSLEQG